LVVCKRLFQLVGYKLQVQQVSYKMGCRLEAQGLCRWLFLGLRNSLELHTLGHYKQLGYKMEQGLQLVDCKLGALDHHKMEQGLQLVDCKLGALEHRKMVQPVYCKMILELGHCKRQLVGCILVVPELVVNKMEHCRMAQLEPGHYKMEHCKMAQLVLGGCKMVHYTKALLGHYKMEHCKMAQLVLGGCKMVHYTKALLGHCRKVHCKTVQLVLEECKKGRCRKVLQELELEHYMKWQGHCKMALLELGHCMI
jgi:hypothetical protein